MKSYEVVVPRNLIKKFYLHPEDFGDGAYVVDLINGMYTDVFYNENGDFITITNNKELISYLKSNESKPRDYFYRNGVFALRVIEDYDADLIKHCKSKKDDYKISLKSSLPTNFLLCFYWIEVGLFTYKDNLLTLRVFENNLISPIDIDVAFNLIVENNEKIKKA